MGKWGRSMSLQQLADELREMYETAPKGERAAYIHSFGIRYAAELDRFSPASVADRAGLQRWCGTEVNKGRNLAKYVDLKPQVNDNARRRFLS